MFESVFATGEPTWSEDLLLILNRNLPQEEGYFTFSYGPLWEADGSVAGIFCTCYETTGRVIGERQLALLSALAAGATDAHSVTDACAQSARALSENPRDLPFAAIYLVDPAWKTASLRGSCGIEPGHAAAPVRMSLDNPSPWPVAAVIRTQSMTVVTGLERRFAGLPAGPWPQPPVQAAVLPIAPSGPIGRSGALIVGVNPFRPLDESYRRFLALVAGQIAAIIANAEAYEEERRRAEVLAELDRAKTTFFSNVSHEFRTPLTLMLGPLEEALAAPADALARRRDDLALVHRNGLRLLRLVNTLLDFSRIEAGRIRASYEPVDLARFTAELASEFRAAIEKAGLRFTVDCAPVAEPVWVDRDMWEKIVLNLISNAFKFTLEGGITVRLRQTNGAVELAVEDSGTGIPAHELPRLFERFHRVEGARGRTHEGTGIGLALVQELVKLHGGAVRAESLLGRGSTFTVAIPLGSAHLPADRLKAGRTVVSTALAARPYVAEALRWLPDAAPGLPAEEVDRGLLSDEPSAEDMGERPTIVLADDNADMRDYVRRLLAPRYEVRTAADGAAALAALRERRPDLLLSDVMMPRLDGFELVRAVRAKPALADLPIVLLSARAGEDASIEGLEAGADDYLIKPFGARELLARVAANLKTAELRRTFEARLAADLQDMTRLHEVGNRCVREGDNVDARLGDILDAAIAIMRAAKGNIQLLDPESSLLEIAAHRGFEQRFLGFFARVDGGDAAACGAALQSGQRVIVEDVMRSDVFAGHPSFGVLVGAGVRAVQSTPLVSSAGRVLGIISTHFDRPHRPTERELRLMDLLARQAADYLERAEARRAAERAAARVARLQVFTAAVSESVTPEDVAEVMLRYAVEDLGAGAAALTVIDADDGSPKTIGLRGYSAELAARWWREPLTISAVRDALQSAEVVWSTSWAMFKERYPGAEPPRDAVRQGARAAVPLMLHGRAIGVLYMNFGETRRFAADELGFMLTLGRQGAQALERARLYAREHQVAATLQRALLPAALPQIPGIQIDAVYRAGMPDSDVGGDWYDALALPDGRLMLTVGDVVGRGLAAAVTMGQMRQAVRAAALEGRPPSEVLALASRLLRAAGGDQDMTTAILGVLDPLESTFTYATAGHPAPLLVGDRGAEVLPSGGLPLGFLGEHAVPQWTVDLPSGALLVLYTDGLTEAHRDPDAGLAALRAATESVQHTLGERPAQAIVETIGLDTTADDVAVVTVHLDSTFLDRLDVTLSAEPNSLAVVRQTVRRLARAWRLDEVSTFGLTVAVGEAVNNAIEHAYGLTPGTVTVRAWREGDVLRGEVADAGRWRAPVASNQGGRGFNVMRMFVDFLDVVPTESGTRVSFAITRSDSKYSTKDVAAPPMPPAESPRGGSLELGVHDFAARVRDGVPVVTIPGDVDLANLRVFTSALNRAAVSSNGPLILTWPGAAYFDSHGIRALLQCASRLATTRRVLFLVVPGGSPLRRLFAAVGLDVAARLFDSTEEAIAAAAICPTPSGFSTEAAEQARGCSGAD
ncbi:MAG TPA: SpoIIE family protein phosphatase [bacterium]|nr:SpoIIE family protein phosphatase [bacterium]